MSPFSNNAARLLATVLLQAGPLTAALLNTVLLPAWSTVLRAAEPVATIVETFDAAFDAKRFTTPIPNKNTSVRDCALWTRGSSGGKYPPMVYLPVAGTDLTISFRG